MRCDLAKERGSNEVQLAEPSKRENLYFYAHVCATVIGVLACGHHHSLEYSERVATIPMNFYWVVGKLFSKLGSPMKARETALIDFVTFNWSADLINTSINVSHYI